MGSILSIGESPKAWIQIQGFDGFDLEIEYLSPPVVKELSKQATIRKLNKLTRQMEETVDNELLAKLMTKRMIRNWRGLTVKILSQIVPLSSEAAAKIEKEHGGELPYSPEDLEILTDNSYSRVYMDAVMESVVDLQIMRELEKKGLEKNSRA
jgi:hypothetical protein